MHYGLRIFFPKILLFTISRFIIEIVDKLNDGEGFLAINIIHGSTRPNCVRSTAESEITFFHHLRIEKLKFKLTQFFIFFKYFKLTRFVLKY